MAPNEALVSDWNARVERCFQAAAGADTPNPALLPHPSSDAPHLTRPEWGALPVRVTRCLPRQSALELLDWRTAQGDVGRRYLQEEYLEWRVVRDAAGRIVRVEMTTELPESWHSLAAHEPNAMLELIAERAREGSVPTAAVYGDLDPFASGVSPRDRGRAFAHATLRWEARNPYNNGERAICCMAHRTNTLHALVELVARAALPFVVNDTSNGGVRCATAAEIIPRIWSSAQAGRNSDPVLVERLVRLAFEGRLIALDEPIGVYVSGVEHTRLHLPDGSEVPQEWLTLLPGALAPLLTDEPAGYQRVVFEIPASEHLSIEDLTDSATEERIGYGGQLADLVQLSVPLRTSEPEGVRAEPEHLRAANNQAPLGCEKIVELYKTYRGSLTDSPISSR